MRKNNKTINKKPDNERINRLAKPRHSIDKCQSSAKSQYDIENSQIKRSLLLASKNSESLKKLKYKNEFLKAIKEMVQISDESPEKKNSPKK